MSLTAESAREFHPEPLTDSGHACERPPKRPGSAPPVTSTPDDNRFVLTYPSKADAVGDTTSHTQNVDAEPS
jgi:hypothetical protein